MEKLKKLKFTIIIYIVISAVLSGMLLTVFADADEYVGAFELTAQEEEYLRSLSGRQVTLAATSEIISFSDIGGNPSGLLLPFIELLGTWGVEIVPHISSWDNENELATKDGADLVGPFALCEDRLEQYAATKPLFVPNVGVYTRINEKINNIVNIDKKTVGVTTNSVLVKLLRSYIEPTTQVKYFANSDALLSALSEYEVDVALTELNIISEFLRYPEVMFEMSLTNVSVPQCIYSAKPEMEPLLAIISRYLESGEGQGLIDAIKLSGHESVLKKAQMYLADEIRDLRQNYTEIKFYDSGVAYPLCYIEDGEYKGFQIDINRVFEDLTGVPINIVPKSEFREGFITAIDEIRAGRLEGASSIYYYSEFGDDPDFEFSCPVITDKLGFYSLTGIVDDLTKARIGTTKFAAPYIDWQALAGGHPEIYGARGSLLGELKKGAVDVVFLSEMSVDYHYSVQNDYSLKQASHLSASADLCALLNAKNKSLNKLYNEAIILQELLYPESRSEWLNTPRNDKFEFMRLQAELKRSQWNVVIAVGMLALVMMIALLIVRLQLKKFSTYDRQIAQMLKTQQNTDMIWGNIKSGKLISKGSFPLFRNWGYTETKEKSYNDIAIESGVLERGKEALRIIEKENLPYHIDDGMVAAPNDDKPRYIRRYTHKINEDEFMLLSIDITQEKRREEELSRLANTDYLSALLNRRAMSDKLKALFERVGHEDVCIFIFMLDIDNFKVVNDKFGHGVGDNVLIGIAEIITKITDGSIVSRWGGEEFLVSIEVPSLAAAVKIAGDIVKSVEKTEFNSGEPTSLSVTISCGVSEMRSGDKDFMSSVSRADKAMYIAKREGKNCVRVMPEENRL